MNCCNLKQNERRIAVFLFSLLRRIRNSRLPPPKKKKKKKRKKKRERADTVNFFSSDLMKWILHTVCAFILPSTPPPPRFSFFFFSFSM